MITLLVEYSTENKLLFKSELNIEITLVGLFRICSVMCNHTINTGVDDIIKFTIPFDERYKPQAHNHTIRDGNIR